MVIITGTVFTTLIIFLKSVVFANLPTRIGEYLKDQFTCFYIAFCVFDEEEEDDQHSFTSEHGNDNNSDTESEGGQAGETEQIQETQVEQEEPNSLVMQFCREVDDDPETDTDTPQESYTVGEGSPRRFKSTSIWMLMHRHLALSLKKRKL